MLFAKQLKDVTYDDLQELIEKRIPEDLNIEYKRELSKKNNNDCSWTTKLEISEKARNELLEEIIAFANTDGGTLFIGIQETKSKPSAAEKITPIENCHELAERLQQSIRDTVEPPLTVETCGISEKDEKCGVVIVRVPRSRKAPHRNMATRKAHVRRNSSSVEMTMSEIQDLTLNLDRGLERVEKRMREFIERDKVSFKQKNFSAQRAYQLSAIFVPLETVLINNPHQHSNLHPRLFSGKVSCGQIEYNIDFGDRAYTDRPIVRGTSASVDRGSSYVQSTRCEMHSDACIYFTLSHALAHTMHGEFHLYESWIISVIEGANNLLKEVRKHLGRPNMDWAYKVFLHTSSQLEYHPVSQEQTTCLGTLYDAPHEFPQSLASHDSDILNTVRTDFWNLLGKEPTHPIIHI